MAVPKKRTSRSKKLIRKNIWKKKGYLAAVKAFSLAKSISTECSKQKVFLCNKQTNKQIIKSWNNRN
uniref:Large ribosomal subunit protein bL32c n=2 Tax=Strelitzia TaxID=4665 RepID=A0A3G2Z6G0_9LILI|nr:ribosomal protein L32 [Strelitzia caudata]AYP35052.1 ribosomal protein L32 [Strelitzia reginae]